MTGKIIRFIIGLVLIVVALVLYFALHMFWVPILCAVVGVVVFISGFMGKKQAATAAEPSSSEPAAQEPPTQEPPSV
ncbi:hypothetical protein KJ969_00310 [Patescibacteria group bacterium]|nr:hypothetical protein [Patescibacteria group bacterium]MBU1921729.1 hypothetical protein [Patescibacteria group bacterium]